MNTDLRARQKFAKSWAEGISRKLGEDYWVLWRDAEASAPSGFDADRWYIFFSGYLLGPIECIEITSPSPGIPLATELVGTPEERKELWRAGVRARVETL